MTPDPAALPSRGLWSLWDMLTFQSSLFLDSISHLKWVAALVEQQSAARQSELIDDENSRIGEGALQHMATVLDYAKQLELTATTGSIQRLIAKIQKGSVTFRELGAAQVDIFSRLQDELSGVRLIYLEPRFKIYFDAGAAAFGESVFTAFPSVITDVEDSGKCLALSQPTACVFHLTRIMEAALKALARPLGIPYAPSWESYLKQINTKLDVKHADKLPAWKKKEPFFRDVAGDLQVVKFAFRNPTMHIVRHYTTDEAEEIYRAVRGLMKRLAAEGLKDGKRPH